MPTPSKFPFPNVDSRSSSIGFSSKTAKFESPWGAVKTEGRGNETLKFVLTIGNTKDAERRALMNLHARLNGMNHRLLVHDESHSPAGVLSVSNLQLGQVDDVLTVGDWSNAAWQSLTALDNGGFRVTRLGNAVNGQSIQPGALTLVAGTSYAVANVHRAYVAHPNTGTIASVVSTTQFGINDINAQAVLRFANTRTVVGFTAPAVTVHCGCNDTTGFSPGAFSFFDILSSQVARAFLVDNGFNAVTRSSEFDDAAWTKTNSTITANAATARDGTTTADEFIEASDTAQTHFMLQDFTRASVIEYWTGTVVLEANTNQRIRLLIGDGGSNFGSAYFDATLGTITLAAAAAGTATNAYATITDLTGGRFLCRVSVRVPSTATARFEIHMCDGATNTTNYNGDGVSGVYLSEAQLQRGGQIGRHTPTTTVAITGTNQTGAEIWLKGLDSNVTGQRVAGDQIEINGQLCILQEDLDGDLPGVGLAVVRPRIRIAPPDEAAVVLYRPTGIFMLEGNENSWSNRPGVFSNFSLPLSEDPTL